MPSVLEVISSKKKNSPQSDHFSYQYIHSIQIFFTTDHFELKADEKFLIQGYYLSRVNCICQ